MSDKNMQKPDHDSFDELLKSALSEKIEEEIPEKEDTEYSFSEEFLTGIAESIENADSIAVAEERHGRSRRKRPEGEKVSQDKAQSAQEAMNGKIIPLAGLGRHKRMIVNAASLLIVLGLGVFIVKEGGIRFAGSSAEQANTEAAAETPEAGQPSAAAYQAETAPEEDAVGETGASREALQDSGETEGTQALNQEPESSYTADTRAADTGDTEEADRGGSSGSRTDRDGDDAEGEGSGSSSVRETASSSRQSTSGSGSSTSSRQSNSSGSSTSGRQSSSSGSSTGSRQSSSGSSTGSRNSGSTSGGSSSGTSGRTSGTSGQRETTAAPAQTGQTGAAAADTGAGSTVAGTTTGTQAAEGTGSGTGTAAGTTAENETAATTAAAEMQESQAAGTAPGALPETGLANPIVPVLNAEALWELLEIRIDVPEELLAQETDSQKPQYNAIGGEAAEIRYESKALEEEVIYRAMKAERGEDPSGVYYVFDPAREESFTSTVSTKDGQLRRVEFLLRRTAGAAPDGTLVTWTIDRTNYSLWVAPSSGKETEIKNEAKALLEAAWEDALEDFTVSDLEQLKPDGPQG